MKVKLSHPFSVSNRNLLSFALSVMLLAVSLFGSVAYAAGEAAVNAKTSQLEMSNLSPGIAMQLQKSGEADVIVVLDDSDANAYAARERKRLGLRHDDAAILSGKAQLFSQRKERVMKGLSGANYTLLKDYDSFPILYMRVNAQALARLKGMSDVKSVTEDRVVRPLYTDSQTLIGIPSAWTYGSGQTGTGTSVAVLDSGIDYVASGITTCANAGDPGCVGYDHCFATGGCTTDLSHGTNVSGIVFQTAPDTEVLALNVFYIDGFAHYNDIISALNWVMANYTTYNIVAVNMSFGENGIPETYTSPCAYDGLAPVMSTLKAAGIATVVASGDLGFSDALTAPACAPDAVSVGAVYANDGYGAETWPVCTDSTTAKDQVACFSDSASFLSMLAPGVDITQPGGVTMSGTSQSAPFVSGAIAVVQSQYAGLSVDQEVARLKATGTAVTDARNSMTFPRLDLNAAVSVSSPIILPEPSDYTFMAEQGGPNPSDQTIDIQNAGIGTMGWTFTPDPTQTWATANPSTGVDAGTTTLSVDTSGFGAPGTYLANPQISSTGALNTPVTVPVTLDLIDPAYSEDFESATLTNKFPWVTGGDGSWTTVSSTGHTGTYAAQSPAMTDNQSSYLQVTLNVTSPDYVYFWVKTDTEPDWDNLKFYVDGTNAGLWTGWSGATDWTFVRSEHEVTPGVHVFKWVYSKDISGSQGSDTVWLDDIFFPPVNLLSVSPVSYDFGEVAVNGSSTPETLTVTNMSGAGVTLGSVSLSGTNASEFAMASDTCSSQTLAAAGTCTVDVTFNPTSQADGKVASLSIPAVGSPAVTAASLSGTGGLKDQLTINKSASTGTGTVSSTPSGIDCGSTCSARFFDGSTVTLTAAADAGSTFTGWSGGGCSGTAPCDANLTADTTVSATFDMDPPTADFSAAPLSGAAPFTVTFTDASSGNTSAWAWNFGDGGLSSTQNPVYTYTNPGTYSVSLTAANSGGSDTMTKNAYISVTCPVSPDDIRIPRTTSLYFSIVQDAFNAAFYSGDTIQIHDSVTIVDNPSLNSLKTITLRGGYDPCFTTSSGYSTIQGSLTIADGTLTVDRITIQ